MVWKSVCTNSSDIFIDGTVFPLIQKVEDPALDCNIINTANNEKVRSEAS